MLLLVLLPKGRIGRIETRMKQGEKRKKGRKEKMKSAVEPPPHYSTIKTVNFIFLPPLDPLFSVHHHALSNFLKLWIRSRTGRRKAISTRRRRRISRDSQDGTGSRSELAFFFFLFPRQTTRLIAGNWPAPGCVTGKDAAQENPFQPPFFRSWNAEGRTPLVTTRRDPVVDVCLSNDANDAG